MKRSAPPERRAPLRAKNATMRQGSSLPAQRKPLPKQSSKTKADQPRRREVCEITKERANGHCEAAHLLPTPCAGPLDTHERLSRARSGGTSQYDATLTALLCRAHHQWTTEHPAWAESVELLLPSGPSLKSKLLTELEESA